MTGSRRDWDRTDEARDAPGRVLGPLCRAKLLVVAVLLLLCEHGISDWQELPGGGPVEAIAGPKSGRHRTGMAERPLST